MTSTFIFGQNVYLSGKFVVAGYRTWFTQNLTSFDLSSLDTTKQGTDVVTSLSLVKQLTEHLNTCYNSLLGLLMDTNDLYFIRYVKSTTLYSTSSNGSTTCDGEYVLYRHQERLVNVTLRIRNVAVNSVHQFHDLVAPLAFRIFQSLQSRTLDDRSVISRELILVKQLTDLHLNQLKQLLIVNHVTLVHEYNDVRNAYLTGQKDVLSCLSHNTVSSSYYKDSSVHLSSTSDHVLYVVSMSWAVNVCVVTFLCLVLNVCSRDSDSTLSLFRSLVDVVECNLCVTSYSLGQNLCDSCSQSGFTMVNVTDGTNITMRFCSFKFSFCHFEYPPYYSALFQAFL